MNGKHMSTWEQEEYVLGAPPPEMMAHLEQCAECRGGVEQLQQGIALYRATATEWSDASLEARLQNSPIFSARPAAFTPALRWALAAMLLLLALLPVYFLAARKPVQLARHDVVPATTAAPLSDDALLQEVDQQVSEAVPDSMESLTHLVTTNAAGSGSKSVSEREQRAQTN